ncbi:T3SS effector HopA1 family protein [Azorhizobium sp. AG788]|uniref:T3SS effector HopA1 family protein n=1 Tax=Azorhizobium sp. AG788 TaxID=2183897 RepID=UPI003139CD2E
MPTAADEYQRNIAFFASLTGQTGTVKLEFNATTGRFSLGSRALLRTLDNWTSSSAAKQSVLNDLTFHDPIVAVFRAAALHNMPILDRRNAYQGLASLRRQYTEPDKSARLQATLVDVLQFVPSALIEQTRARYRDMDPDTVLGPLDRAFMDIVWEQRAALFELLDAAEAPDLGNDVNVRPYAQLANRIYGLYGGHIEPRITNMRAWVAALPALMGEPGARYYYLQHSDIELPVARRGEMVTNGDYGSDFVYYTTGHGRENEKLWRIYLNFEAAAAPDIINHLWDLAGTHRIHSFKIGGPLTFHTRVDKIVIYVRLSGLQTLLDDLIHHAVAFRCKDPVPQMTIQLAAGIAKGIEPGSLDLGFSVKQDRETRIYDFNPRELKRQSYGSIRAQLIAAALTQMHAVVETDALVRGDYRSNKTVFLKWVAIAFESYRAQLQGD